MNREMTKQGTQYIKIESLTTDVCYVNANAIKKFSFYENVLHIWFIDGEFERFEGIDSARFLARLDLAGLLV